jgi:hypothetical protein
MMSLERIILAQHSSHHACHVMWRDPSGGIRNWSYANASCQSAMHTAAPSWHAKYATQDEPRMTVCCCGSSAYRPQDACMQACQHRQLAGLACNFRHMREKQMQAYKHTSSVQAGVATLEASARRTAKSTTSSIRTTISSDTGHCRR